MNSSLWKSHILPFAFLLGLLAAVTLAGDYFLHRLDLVWVGRYLGILGTLLIICALYYSARKRKWVSKGNPKTLIRLHEFGTWLGSAMVLIHSGIHINAVLPWLATAAMSAIVVSGLVGKILLKQSQQHVKDKRGFFEQQCQSQVDIERAMYWDALALKAMMQWRKVHIPIFLIFATLALGHIFSIFLFWRWA